MNSLPPESPKNAAEPQARESEWYNEHYKTSGTAPAKQILTGHTLLKHLGPWYGYALPHLRNTLTPSSRVLELGCGTGRLPTQLVREGLVTPKNVFGLDQSQVAVDQAKAAIPEATFFVGDIYNLELPKAHFDVVLLMEVIEHLEFPDPALQQIASVVGPNGLLYVSFPNYLHLPWLAVRILAEKLNRPNWIVLQPIDKIYTVGRVRKLVEKAGFVFEHGIGSNYGPPVLYPLEKPWMTNTLNKLGFWWLSFHPILVFRKRN